VSCGADHIDTGIANLRLAVSKFADARDALTGLGDEARRLEMRAAVLLEAAQALAGRVGLCQACARARDDRRALAMVPK
jgi:hypothetical protein